MMAACLISPWGSFSYEKIVEFRIYAAPKGQFQLKVLYHL